MKGASFGLMILGIVVALVGLVNHYMLHQNPIAHTSTYLGAVAAVLFVVGLAMFFLGGRTSAR
jgi:hypothetical protein